jgi:WD40 repeat protein
VITDIDLSEDGRSLAVAAGSTVSIHEANNLSAPPRVIQATGNVGGVSLSPGGERLALTVHREGVQVWAVAPARLLFAVEDARDPQFSPDGGALAVVTDTGVAVWDSWSGEEEASYKTGYALRPQFSPSGARIAVWADREDSVAIYDWRENRLVSETRATIHPEDDIYPDHYPQVSDVRFLNEEDLLLLVLEDMGWSLTGRIEVQRAGEDSAVFSARPLDLLVGATKFVCNEPVWYYDPPQPPQPYHMELTADGQIVALRYEQAGFGEGGEYSSVRFFRTADGQRLYAVEEGIVDFELAPDGQTWVAGRQDGRLEVRRVSDGTVLDSVDRYESPALNVRVSPDDQWAGIVTVDEVKVVRTEDGAVAYRYPANDMAFAPDRPEFALAYDDGRIEIRELADGGLRVSMAAHRDRVSALTYLPSGQLLSAGFDCELVRWDAGSMRRVGTLENVYVEGTITQEMVAVRVDDFLVMPDGETVVGRFMPGNIAVWQVEDGRLVYEPGWEQFASVLAIAPDRQWAVDMAGREADSCDDGITFVTLDVSTAAFSPDSRLLAAGRWGGDLEVWEVANRALLHTAEPESGAISAVAFTRDGTLILAAGLDGVVKLWGVK